MRSVLSERNSLCVQTGRGEERGVFTRGVAGDEMEREDGPRIQGTENLS